MENSYIGLFSLAFKPGSFITLKPFVKDTVGYDRSKDSYTRLTDIGLGSLVCMGEVARLYIYLKMAATTYNALF